MKRILLGVPATLVLAACSSGGTAASGTPTNVPSPIDASTAASTPPPSAAPSSSVSPSASVTPSAHSAAPSPSAQVGPCVDGQLAARSTDVEPDTSMSYTILVFTNVGSSACIVSGYPGVAVIGPSGAQSAQATRQLSQAPHATGPKAVTLAPHQSASATLAADHFPTGTLKECPGVAGLLVTPPGSHVSSRVGPPRPAVSCSSPSIYPVVAGLMGDIL